MWLLLFDNPQADHSSIAHKQSPYDKTAVADDPRGPKIKAENGGRNNSNSYHLGQQPLQSAEYFPCDAPY